jgi:hypothetical protein
LDTNHGIYWIAATFYWLELAFTFLISTLVSLAALTVWMLEGKSRSLQQIEGVLPLKGRWLRYLAAACLFPVVALVPAVLCLLLALVPPVPGLCALTTALVILLRRAALREQSTLVREKL